MIFEKEGGFRKVSFLDVFSDKETEKVGSWNDLEPLKTIAFTPISGFNVADINTLVALKCHALFARDKTDKQIKDGCDLYALLQYSDGKIARTDLLMKAIEKILQRSDLLYYIATEILLDSAKKSIAQISLESKMKELQKDA